MEEICPILLHMSQHDEEQEEGGSLLQGHGPLVLEAVMMALQQLWEEEEPRVEVMHYGLALLCQLLKWDSLRDLMLKGDYAALVVDMALVIGHDSSPMTLTTDMMDMQIVLAVDATWRQALGGAGCLHTCFEAALRHHLDEAVQARALKFIHLMCFEEENIPRILTPARLEMVYKVRLTE